MDEIFVQKIIPLISRKPLAHQQEWLQRFELLLPNEKIKLASEIKSKDRKNCEFAIVLDPDPEIVASFSNLEWIQSLWAGVESLVELAKAQEIKLVRMIDPMLADTMAEAVLAWTLYLHRQMPTYATLQKNKTWLQLPYKPAEYCNVGILGLGEMGKTSAQRLLANGFNLLGWSRNKKSLSGIKCFSGDDGLIEMTKKSDILICLLPLTPETKNIINSSLLAQLPRGASVINFARGPHLIVSDLLNALEGNHLYHAVLDVYEQEPLPEDHLLWSHPKITILPHIAATSYPQTAAEIAAQNIIHFRNTGQLKTVVDLSKGY